MERRLKFLTWGTLALAFGPALGTVALAGLLNPNPSWPHIFWGLGGWGLGLLTGLVTGLSHYQGISREFLGFLSGALVGPLLAVISTFANLLARNNYAAPAVETTTEKTTIDGNTTYHFFERKTTPADQTLPTDLTPFVFAGLFLLAYTSGAMVGLVLGASLRNLYPGGGINIEEDPLPPGRDQAGSPS